MKNFQFIRPRSSTEATEALAETPQALVHAGGVDLLDRMKEGTSKPAALVSLVDTQGLAGIEIDPSGDIRIGARVTLAALAGSEAVQRFLPTLAEAAGDAASPQLRNRATLAGNLLQHTRCGYYRLASFPCLKRGGSSCPVRVEGGVQDYAGIVHNEPCASAHPSSVAPVLGTLDAELIVRKGAETRVLSFADLWAPPRAGVPGDTVLGPDELIETIVIPARDHKPFLGHAEIRQKAAFDWALVTCSVRYALEGETIRDARVWFGSLAPTPWRAAKAEAVLVGGPCTDAAAEKAAAAALADATPLAGTTYKVQLAKVALKRALAAAREVLMSQRDGEYAADVRRELRVRCLHLLTKEAFLELPSDHERAFEADEPIWWCDQTSQVLGPDGSEACRKDCHGPGRTCYEGPLRL